MKAKLTHRLPVRLWRFGIGGLLLAGGALLDHRGIAGQTVMGNPLPQPPLQTLDQQDEPNEMDVFQPAGQPADVTLPSYLQYGPVQAHPHADYRFTYGSGIQNAPGEASDTIEQELSTGVALDVGRHWVVDYTPTFRFYSSDKFKDGVDHSVTLTGNLAYDAWKLGLSQISQFTSAPMSETAAQTDQSSHATSLTAGRALTSNLSADFSLNQTINQVSGYQDSYDWNTMDWINYTFWPRLNAGLGVGGGYVLTEGDNNQAYGNNNDLDQTYQELQARVNWRATEKISFQISGGFEDRQFSTAGTGDSLSPLYGASIQYQPFSATQISLSANRTVSSSDYYLAAQQTETTVLAVNLNQRLLKKFTLGLGLDYSQTDFNTASGYVSGGSVNRTDNMVSFNARLSHPFYKRGTWSVFYQYSDNRSSEAGFGYQSNQMGFELTYRF